MSQRPQATSRPSPRVPDTPATTEQSTISIGVIGARGHTGAALLSIIARHAQCTLGFASSRSLIGEPVNRVCDHPKLDGCFVDSTIDLAQRDVDAFILALPNGHAQEYVDAINAAHGDAPVIIDLSADYRFDDEWVYGLAEFNTTHIARARRIANPGCYATAMMLSLAPIVDDLAATPCSFGISGYSGAGTTPSPRNNAEQLRDNIMPYQLADHIHEREVSRHLGRAIRFTPHVAPFFRGISMTSMATLTQPTTAESLMERYETYYASHPLIQVRGAEVPLVRDAANQPHAFIGGLTVSEADPHCISVVATLDNLLKGAAAQAMQNINLAFGFDPMEGILE